MKAILSIPILASFIFLIYAATFASGCSNSENQKSDDGQTGQMPDSTITGILDSDPTTGMQDSGTTTDSSGGPGNHSETTEVETPEPAPSHTPSSTNPKSLQKNTTSKPAVTQKPAPSSKTDTEQQTEQQTEQPAEKPAPPKPAPKNEPVPQKPVVEPTSPKPADTLSPVVNPEPKKPTEVIKPPVPKPVPVEPAPSNPGPKNGVWTAPASAKGLKNPVAVDATSLAAGKKAYKKECLSCHGKKGKGNGPSASALEKAPANLLTEKVAAQSDGELFWKITEGKKPMSSAKKTLTETQRWQVVNYVRELGKSKGHHRH